MKLIPAAAITLSLLASASVQANGAGAAADPGFAHALGSESIRITRGGSQPSRQGPAGNFTGSVHIDPLFQATAPAHASGVLVTFEPGARTAGHTHPRGLILIVTDGVGRALRWGDPTEDIRQGDVDRIPPVQKHWHEAAPDSSMAHIAISERLNAKSFERMEKVTDAQYRPPLRADRPATPAPDAQPGPPHHAIGDFAPK